MAKWIGHVKDDPTVMLYAWDQITARICVKNEGYGALEVLVKNGMDPNTRVSAVYPHTTALMAVAEHYSPNSSTATSAGKTLIDHNANVNVCNSGGSALTRAARNGHTDLANVMIASGANVDVPGQFQTNPLHAAVSNGHTKIVDMLLAAGADPNVVNTSQETALFYSKSVDTARALLGAGCDPECVSRRGITADQQQWEHGKYVLPDDVRALLRQSKLEQIASRARPDDLASPEEALSRRSRGRFM